MALQLAKLWQRGNQPAPAEAPPPQDAPPLVLGRVPAPLHTDPARSAVLKHYVGGKDTPVTRYERGKAGVGYRTTFGIVREVIAKDGRVAGLYQQRKSAVLRRLMYLQNADTSEPSQYCASFMSKALRRLDFESAQMGGWLGDLNQMLDAPFFGIYVGKLVWGQRSFAPMTADRKRKRGRDWVVPTNIIQEDLDRVGFDGENRLCIHARYESEAAAALDGFRPVPGMNDWWYPHPLSYIVFNPYSQNDNPFGWALLEVAFYAAWFKRLTRMLHAQFIERNTTPVATFEATANAIPPGTEELEQMEEVLQDLQAETGLRVPIGWEFRWKELLSTASAQAIEAFERFLDYEIAAALIGQSSTSMTERSGSMSSAQVQERVADSIVAMDAQMLQGSVNQLIRMVMAVNLPDKEDNWPNFVVQIASAQDLEKRMTQMKEAVGLGVKIPMRQVQREFAFDEALPGEDVLEIQPAAYAQPGSQPSQQKQAKTPARARQRERRRPSSSEAQPRRGQ